MKLLQALRNASSRIQTELEDSNLFNHSGDKGEFRERIVAKFLRPFLPECYGIGSGEVFSSDGQASRQIDLVIYDAVFSNVLFRDSQNSLFPCEAVYGSVEVKSNLTSAELNQSIINIASLKTLRREDSNMMDILPFRHFVVGQGLTFDRKKRNPYLGVVFGFDSVSAEIAVRVLNEHLAQKTINKEHLPDFIFSYKQGFMLLRARGTEPARMGEDFDSFRCVYSAGDTLPLFFLTLTIVLNQTHLKSPDFNKYWIDLMTEATNRGVK